MTSVQSWLLSEIYNTALVSAGCGGVVQVASSSNSSSGLTYVDSTRGSFESGSTNLAHNLLLTLSTLPS